MSPHADNADEAAAFHASKVEPGQHAAVSMSGARTDLRAGNPRIVDSFVRHAMASAAATIAKTFGRRLSAVERGLTPESSRPAKRVRLERIARLHAR